MSISVGITDDHPVVLRGIQTILQQFKGIEVNGVFGSGKELLAALQKQHYDVVMLDIQMPDMQGDELAKVISRNYPDTRILVLTNKNQAFFVQQLFRNGASGYILKHAEPGTIYEAIVAVHNGETFVDPSLKEKVNSELRHTEAQPEIPTLTRREKEILELIAEEKTSPQIASLLFITTSTVENHRLNLFLKLGVKNAVGLVNKGKQLGLID